MVWATGAAFVITGLLDANYHFVSDIVGGSYLAVAIGLGITELKLPLLIALSVPVYCFVLPDKCGPSLTWALLCKFTLFVAAMVRRVEERARLRVALRESSAMTGSARDVLLDIF